MKTIAAMLTLGVACWAFGTQAQTFDTRLLSQYDASVLRELYPVCRHTTVSAEQQVRLAERIRQENLRFAELIRCDGGVLAPASETELERMRDNALREILTEEQLLQYYRYEALPAAYARGREAKKIVSKQLQLTYMELKYVKRITLGNTVAQRIAVSLFPAYVLPNVIFQQAFYSGDALYVDQHGNLTVRKTGTATIHVIPAQNTSLAQTIEIEVTAPVIRKAGSVMRFLSGSRIRKV